MVDEAPSTSTNLEFPENIDIDDISSSILVHELESPVSESDLDECSPDLTQAIHESQTRQSVLPLIKHELKYKILYRRHSEGQGDIPTDVEEQPKVYQV